MQSGIVVVVVVGQGHARATVNPTAAFRQNSESVAVALESPLASHTQGGWQSSRATDVRRMNKQSVVVGNAPVLSG